MECISLILVFASLVAIFKVYLKLKIGRNESPVCLVGKTAIITGANTGIGFQTAQDFASRGARVILACRDKSKAEEARKKIIEATDNPNVFAKILDLTSLDSIRRFAKEINETEENLHILVNNAGVGGVGHQITSDGLDLLMQVNYFGPFLLTNLLIDLLKKSGPSRIVNVSSLASKWAQLKPNDLNGFPEGKMAQTVHYSNSKFSLVLFTNELARRLRNSNVIANSLHPGTVNTELFRTVPKCSKPIFNIVSGGFFKNAEEGAQTTIYAAVSKEVQNISGEYLDNCRIGVMPKGARDEGLAKKVWEETEKIVKLTKEERRF